MLLSRGILEQKKGKTSNHFNGDSMNTELLFQTIHSVNQLSVYGAVVNWCYQFGFDRRREWTSQYSCEQQDFWPSWNRKKYNSWYLHRHSQLETGCQRESWVSTSWPVRYSWHTCAKKLTSSILLQLGSSTKFDQMGATDGEQIAPLCDWEYSISRYYPKAQALAAIPEGNNHWTGFGSS